MIERKTYLDQLSAWKDEGDHRYSPLRKIDTIKANAGTYDKRRDNRRSNYFNQF